MKKVIINESQRGLLFKNGKFKALLGPGKYREGFGRMIEVRSIQNALGSIACTLPTLLANPEIAAATYTVTVGEDQIALLFRNGDFVTPLVKGTYAYFRDAGEYSVIYDTLSDPRIDPSIPKSVFRHMAPHHYMSIEVQPYERAMLYIDRNPSGMLEPGVYRFWTAGMQKISTRAIDTRAVRLDVSGQEMLSADKVTLRINLVCTYRVTDAERALAAYDDLNESLHVAAQLALREYVCSRRLDELLQNREEMAAFILAKLKEKEGESFVTFTDAGIKDIILPGEIREIMNTVLVAEKRAQANVITRREEVASTRSLLNTAKLMEENPTLYRLKELEYIERIFGGAASLNLSAGGGDLIERLSELVGAKKTG